MLGAIPVFYFAAVRRILGDLQEILEIINGVIEEVGVGTADVDVNLALELRPKGRPVALPSP